MPNRLIQIIHSFVPFGMLFWLSLWLIPVYSQTERMILFAACVVVPLTLFRVLENAVKMPLVLLKILIFLIPTGALALAGSFILSPGFESGLLSIPWSLVTFLLAAIGFTLLVKSSGNLADLSTAIGFMYISVGGIWLAAHQMGFGLLGFSGQIMLLTVNHFHYAGFVALILFGLLHSRQSKKSLSSIVILLGGAAPLLIALGMTYSSMLEWVSVIVFAASLLLYSSLVFAYVIPKATRWTKVLHIVSSGAIWVTMTLAVLYGFGEWMGRPTIPISMMIFFHGWGNALLFSFVGILAWHATLMDQATASIPFSRIQGKGKIGSNIFSHLAVLEQSPERIPTGLIDDMKAYRSHTFHPDRLDQDIIDFYERTDDYELLLTPHWSKPFRFFAGAYKALSQWLEQMNFPLDAETNEQQVKSVILPIQDHKDGRNQVRAWVRTYTQTQRAIYAALYSSHLSGRTRYMNIAFPLPYSQMTSILCLRHGPDDTLVLTSWLAEPGTGHQGVYIVLNQKAIRLPINETIKVWKEPGSPKGRIEAKHDMWLFGMRFLTLEYRIFKKK